MAKKRRVWIAMALPLVFMLPNSSCLLFPGNENKSPGDSSTNNTTPMSTGAQSAITREFLHLKSRLDQAWRGSETSSRSYGEKVWERRVEKMG
ncbi:hypothetical protein V6N13_053072 [Hibiscus sabdariffa]|uniref:Uncharacterized protein n=1 Tax=Hibiscus sabdariffa TaxID=183260 RepID=A0ABR2Q667_9ROSI